MKSRSENGFGDEREKQAQTDADMEERELDAVTGGFGHAAIKLCSRCKTRIAVQDMELCGVCYRQTRHDFE